MFSWQKITIYSLIATSAIGGGILLANVMNSSPMVSSCEELIKKKLRSPSSYKQVSINRYEDILTRDQYKKIVDQKYSDNPTLKEYEIKLFDEGRINPKKIMLFIESDAANVYGTPIRSTDKCEYISENGEEPTSYLSVKLNGKTYTDWLKEAIKASR